MNSVAHSLILVLWSSFRTRARMQIEILALRHQLAVSVQPDAVIEVLTKGSATSVVLTFVIRLNI
jgi:hypothetical protein